MTTTRKKDAKLYAETARQMERSNHIGVGWSCWAICEVAGYDLYGEESPPPSEVERFEAAFSPYWPARKHCWAGTKGNVSAWDHSDRILALCFMAAMVEAGDA